MNEKEGQSSFSLADMKCPVCRTNDAIKDPYYGYLPCERCQLEQSRLKRPGNIPEFTSDTIKEGRKEFKDDIEQPHRKGEVNKRWVDLHGVDAAKRHGFTDKEIKKARYVYTGDDSYYKEGN